jgi:hypothetical protein
MNTFNVIRYKNHILSIIFVIFLIILTSCQKNDEILETNKGGNELFLEQESDNLLDNENNNDKKIFSDEDYPLTIRPSARELPSETIWEGTGSNPESSDVPPAVPPAFKDLGNGLIKGDDLLYRYDGVGSIRFGEYFKLDRDNMESINL